MQNRSFIERERVKRLSHIFNDIISFDNLLTSWREFLPGKKKRKDVIIFGLNLTNNLLNLHFDLQNYKYQHGGYEAFKITDPKVRDIHKASVRDRLVHHAIYRILYLYFDRKFIFDSYSNNKLQIGLPLGNLTSQLLINIYMNEFDHFIKRDVKVDFYIRYADDFVILSDNKLYLQNLLPKITEYLKDKLKLTLHSDKTCIKTLASGIDFLGWIHFSDHRVLRTSTKRRMLARIANNHSNKSCQSYFGLIKHGNTFQIRQNLDRFGCQHKKW